MSILKLYCDCCRFLNPKEFKQTKTKEPHMCLLFNRPIFHNGEHPRLPKPEYCNKGKIRNVYFNSTKQLKKF